MAERVIARQGRCRVAEVVGVNGAELDELMRGDREWTGAEMSALLDLGEYSDRRGAGESGVGSGETAYEVSDRGARLAAEIRAEQVDVGVEWETVGANAVADPNRLVDDQEWELPGDGRSSLGDRDVDPALLEKAAKVSDLYALLDAGRERLCYPELPDREWLEITELLCQLELVLIVDYGADPSSPGTEWDHWRCRREEEARWATLREVRRAMESRLLKRLWAWLVGSDGKRDWLAVLMRDVDRGKSGRGWSGLREGGAAEWLGLAGMLELRWQRKGLGKRPR